MYTHTHTHDLRSFFKGAVKITFTNESLQGASLEFVSTNFQSNFLTAFFLRSLQFTPLY